MGARAAPGWLLCLAIALGEDQCDAGVSMMQLRATGARVRPEAPGVPARELGAAAPARGPELLSLVDGLAGRALPVDAVHAAALCVGAGVLLLLLWCCRRRRETFPFRGRMFVQLAWQPAQDHEASILDVQGAAVGCRKGSLSTAEGPAQLQVSVFGRTVSAEFGVDARDEPRVLLRVDPPAMLPALGFPAGQPGRWTWELVSSEPPGRAGASRQVSRFLGAGLLLPLYALQPAASAASGLTPGSADLRPEPAPLLRAELRHARDLCQRSRAGGALLCRRGETTSEPVYAILPFNRREGRPRDRRRRGEAPTIRVVEREQDSAAARSPEDCVGQDALVALAETDPGKPGHVVCTCAVGGQHHEEDLALVVTAINALLDLHRLARDPDPAEAR